MVKGDQWYGYDNEETIKIKMRWLKETGYGGAFIWALDFDDFKGTSCGKGPYPLLSAINGELESESTVSTESSETTTVTSEPTENGRIQTTTSAVEPTGKPSNVECPEPYGIFKHPTDCRSFIHCAHNYAYVFHCPPKTFFNDEIKVCDHLWNAPITCK
ncbi:unnamed protein product [Onchocerca flexuosa]|uniref:Chitin-binding type-2 domain-containing protein n=1 Tax=Onchocerca flexuosa TaxID=387005 RepID=A0A183HQF9_9BILA|nr:unnamed protein product [Onchocerca flexuosa]